MLYTMLVARKKLGLRQQDLADMTGITLKRLAKIERGQIAATVDEAFKISSALNEPIESIFKSDAS